MASVNGLDAPEVARRVAPPVSPRFQAAASPRFPRPSLDDLEGKLMRQIEQVQQRADQGRDVLRAWVETKLGNLASFQTKSDLRIAELTGNQSALSDELQMQVRRSESVDHNLWDWRRQLEEEFRNKMADTDLRMAELSSASRNSVGAVEELLSRTAKQVRSLEAIVTERLRQPGPSFELVDEAFQRIAVLEERTELTESSRAIAPLPAFPDAGTSGGLLGQDRELIADLESQLSDMKTAVQLLQEASNNSCQRLEVHEERMKSMRTIMDQMRESLTTLTSKTEAGDLEGRLSKTTRCLDETRNKVLPRLEQLDMLMRRTDELQDAMEELRQKILFSSRVSPGVSPCTSPCSTRFMERIAVQETPEPVYAIMQPSEAIAQPVLEEMDRLSRRLDGMEEALTKALPNLTQRLKLVEDALATPRVSNEVDAAISQRLAAVEDGINAMEARAGETLEINDRLRLLIKKLEELGPKVEQHDVFMQELRDANIGKVALSGGAGLMDVRNRLALCEDRMAGLNVQLKETCEELDSLRAGIAAQQDRPPAAAAAAQAAVTLPAAGALSSAILGVDLEADADIAKVESTGEGKDLQALAARMERSSRDTIGALEDLASRLQTYDGAFAGLLQRLDGPEVNETRSIDPAEPQSTLAKEVTTQAISKALPRQAEQQALAASLQGSDLASDLVMRRRGTGELQEELKWAQALQQELASSALSQARRLEALQNSSTSAASIAAPASLGPSLGSGSAQAAMAIADGPTSPPTSASVAAPPAQPKRQPAASSPESNSSSLDAALARASTSSSKEESRAMAQVLMQRVYQLGAERSSGASQS